MIMLGAAEQNAGKTEFACRLIRRYKARERIIGIKITTVDSERKTCPRGNEGCAVCTSFSGGFQLTEETGGPAGKDTVRMLEAGANQVFWLKVRKESISSGVAALGRYLDKKTCIICESNSCRQVIEPGIFVVLQKQATSHIKKTCRVVLDQADKIIAFDGAGWDLRTDQFIFNDGRWTFAEHATAIVLAGGKSQRMGKDKSLISISGRPLIELIADQLKRNFENILISSNATNKFDFLELPVVNDSRPDCGPLMGILSALNASKTDLNFITSCDAPNIFLPYVRKMLKAADKYDLVIPRYSNGKVEPLFAIYRKNVAEHCEDLLNRRHYKISGLFDRVRTKFLPFEASEWYQNLNTLEDLEKFKKGYYRNQGINGLNVPGLRRLTVPAAFWTPIQQQTAQRSTELYRIRNKSNACHLMEASGGAAGPH